jgi:hypothetical protein
MKNNVKVERLFERGPIDLFELLHFLVDEIENYKVLEFRSNKGYLIKFYRKGDDLNFMDLIDSKGVKLIKKNRIKYFFEIINLREVEESGLIKQRWSVKHIIE